MSWDGPQLPSADADASAQDHLRPLTRKRSTAASELPLDSLPAARLPEGTDPTVQFFWGLLIAHVVLWTLLPILMHHNPSRETLHLLTLGRQWEWGYHQQPPLPAWLAIASCALTGTAVWPTYLLSAVAGAVCLWAAWRMGREFLRPWTAVCGAIAMEACFYFNYTAPTLTSETLARTFWALAVLTFYWAINKNRRTHWVQMAVCLGLGLLCRYDTFLLFAALFAFTLWSDRARRCWDTSRPFLAAGVIAAVFLPHGWWLTSHVREIGSSMLDYLVATEQVAQTTDRWFIQLAALIPVLVVLAPLVNWFNPPEEETDEDRDFMKQYLVWISILPPATTIVLAVMNGFHIDALWASPLWIYGGVLFLMWSRLEESRFSWRQALTWTGTASGIIAASLFATYVLFPPSLEKGQEVHFPGRSLAAAVNKTWKEKYPDQKLPAVGGPWWLAENAAWYSSDRPTVYGDLDSRENSVRDKHKLEESGGIVILDATAAPSAAEEQFLTQLTNPQISLPIELAWQHTASHKTEPVQVLLAVVPPRQHVTPAAAMDLPTTPTLEDASIPRSASTPEASSTFPSLLDSPASPLIDPTPAPRTASPQPPVSEGRPTAPAPGSGEFKSSIPPHARPKPAATPATPVEVSGETVERSPTTAPLTVPLTVPSTIPSSIPSTIPNRVRPASGAEPVNSPLMQPADFAKPVPVSPQEESVNPLPNWASGNKTSTIPAAKPAAPQPKPQPAPQTAPLFPF